MRNTQAHFEITSASTSTVTPSRNEQPFALVIFGGTGDLAKRKLIPALYHLKKERSLTVPFTVIGVSRSASTNEAFHQLHHENTAKYSRTKPIDAGIWEDLTNSLTCMNGDLNDAAMYQELHRRLDAFDSYHDSRNNHLFYFATPPDAFPAILNGMHKEGLLYSCPPPSSWPWPRVIVEKPFGRDLGSARRLNDLVADILDERQIFRIDHYLGKETVQNILIFRFGNSIFEPIWNRKYIDHVQITAAENIDVEGRGSFYDQTGVIRDVIQNHILEILTFCTMEIPVSFKADDIRDQKVQIYRTIRPIIGENIRKQVVCAQYEGYLAEKGIAPGSRTPTYAALKVFIDNWRWQNIPFYIRAGKNLSNRTTEVSFQFQNIPFCLFGSEETCKLVDPNVLTFRIQPDEGISLRFVCKEPGEELNIGNVMMDFQYATGFNKQPADAYERLLLDFIKGDLTLFSRRDAIEHAWRFITPILEEWEANTNLALASYEAGSRGPREADALLQRDHRRWLK
ncbi:MAG: glucose-6-phosphate dehydrogenase [Candidatus Omnitrophota bacterium]|nr:MAG: glucose-6-phosphate dehydrogenase [Candidatus Omnitrophota bacterium]